MLKADELSVQRQIRFPLGLGVQRPTLDVDATADTLKRSNGSQGQGASPPALPNILVLNALRGRRRLL